MILSYAQQFEDVLLERVFKERQIGSYIDIGAHSPVVDSVTARFYARGWSGVNVEPLPWRHAELVRTRPRDVNLRVLCGENGEPVEFIARRSADGLSSLIHLPDEGGEPISCKVHSLASICENHAPEAIDFLKVDVEGMESSVLRSNDWSRFRPTIVLVEATHPNTTELSCGEWEPFLLSQNYRLAAFDGLNRYYIEGASAEGLLGHFQTPANVFDRAVPFSTFGNVFDDMRHPDHHWARAFTARFMAASRVLGADIDLVILTADLTGSTLDEAAVEVSVEEAFQRALARLPTPHELEKWVGKLPLREVYTRLVHTDEFLLKRARAVPFSI